MPDTAMYRCPGIRKTQRNQAISPAPAMYSRRFR